MQQQIDELRTAFLVYFVITLAIDAGILLVIGNLLKRVIGLTPLYEPQPAPTAKITPKPYSPTFTLARTGRLPLMEIDETKELTEEAWENLMGRFKDEIKGSHSGQANRETVKLEWKPIETFQVPINQAVDVKTKKGTIYTRCYLNSTTPEEWDPEFIKYKGIKYWRYSK